MSLTNEERDYFNRAVNENFGQSPSDLSIANGYINTYQYDKDTLLKQLGGLCGCDFTGTVRDLGISTPESILLIEDSDIGREYRKNKAAAEEIVTLNEFAEVTKISLQTKDLQISKLTEIINLLTIQNNAYKMELDDNRVQLDKKTEEFDVCKGQFDMLKNMICESGIFNCDAMFGKLPPEPDL